MKQTYNTKQRQTILACLEENKSASLTVDGVCRYLEARGEHIGRSTVYRRLEELCKEGVIRRFAPDMGKSVTYRYIGRECGPDCHFHLICTECGGVEHTHCHALEDLLLHMAGEHGFSIDEKKTVLYGKCSKCGGAR